MLTEDCEWWREIVGCIKVHWRIVVTARVAVCVFQYGKGKGRLGVLPGSKRLCVGGAVIGSSLALMKMNNSEGLRDGRGRGDWGWVAGYTEARRGLRMRFLKLRLLWQAQGWEWVGEQVQR